MITRVAQKTRKLDDTGRDGSSEALVRRLYKQLGFLFNMADKHRLVQVAVETAVVRRHVDCAQPKTSPANS